MIARGRVHAVRGGFVQARLPAARIGGGVHIASERTIYGTIVAVDGGNACVALHEPADGLRCGDAIASDDAALTIAAGISGNRRIRIPARVPLPHERAMPHDPFWTGIRSIDAFLTIARGARVGIFSSPGCGKSMLLGQICAGSYADAVVVGLTGERGREARGWTEDLPHNATLFCATSDAPAIERIRTAEASMAHASLLRSYGLHVLLLLDSFARFAYALREVAIATGETVGRAGFPPSVFARMAKFAEVAGVLETGGSMTLVTTVLSDGDSTDPVSEAARSLLDGHIELGALLAQAGRFPAVDVVRSRSRTMHAVVTDTHLDDARAVRSALALLDASAEARSAGIIPEDSATNAALAAEPDLERFLRQDLRPSAPPDTLQALHALADTLR